MYRGHSCHSCHSCQCVLLRERNTYRFNSLAMPPMFHSPGFMWPPLIPMQQTGWSTTKWYTARRQMTRWLFVCNSASLQSNPFNLHLWHIKLHSHHASCVPLPWRQCSRLLSRWPLWSRGRDRTVRLCLEPPEDVPWEYWTPSVLKQKIGREAKMRMMMKRWNVTFSASRWNRRPLCVQGSSNERWDMS